MQTPRAVQSDTPRRIVTLSRPTLTTLLVLIAAYCCFATPSMSTSTMSTPAFLTVPRCLLPRFQSPQTCSCMTAVWLQYRNQNQVSRMAESAFYQFCCGHICVVFMRCVIGGALYSVCLFAAEITRKCEWNGSLRNESDSRLNERCRRQSHSAARCLQIWLAILPNHNMYFLRAIRGWTWPEAARCLVLEYGNSFGVSNSD